MNTRRGDQRANNTLKQARNTLIPCVATKKKLLRLTEIQKTETLAYTKTRLFKIKINNYIIKII